MKSIFFALLFIVFFVSPSISGENNSFNRTRTFDVQHYIIRVDFNRTKRIVYGDSTIQLKPLGSNFKTLELDAEGIMFESVKLESTQENLNYTQNDGKIKITLDKSYEPNDLISVRFKYSVINPKKGIYFVSALKRRGKIIRASQIWTQGESEEAHYWLPSFDFPDDKATTEQFITVRKGETAIANGELIEVIENENGTKTFHYKMPIPHSLYLTSFVIGTYEKVSEKYKDIPLSYYVYPGQKSIVPKAYGKTKDMFRIFEDLTGIDYPFNKYDQTMVADFQFGGMENITATTMADSEILLARYSFAQGLIEDLVSHELAHSWFGNLVTCRNWSELWLNEGFATYMEAAFREKMYGRADYRAKIESDAIEYFTYSSLSDNNEQGLFNRLANPKNNDTLFTTIVYQKGSVVIHTLREEIGEEAFWRGINTYLKRFQFANVETPDLQKIMEESSGKDLDWFFKQWVYGNKYPILRIEQTYDPGSKELILNITQTQTGNEYTPKVFILPLDVEIKLAKDKLNKKINITDRQQVFRIPVDQKPSKVMFDNDFKIPLKIISLSKLTVLPKTVN